MALDPALEAFAAREIMEMFVEEVVVGWDDPPSSPVGHRTSSSGLSSEEEVVSEAFFTSLSSTTCPSISLSESEG